MAITTSKELRNKVIYEVFVRNHGETGTFKDVSKDLKRIKDLGVDIVWFMPIHPIGVINRKGDLGCPYSIKDYTKVNPEYGTEEEFVELINQIHGEGMQVMIDVVYNHTSHDGVYREERPDFYYKTPEGRFGNKVADWSDIIDLDYNNKELWKHQIDALIKWIKLGVDGFRCDVAPMVPMEFWSDARKAMLEINPNAILLAETVHPHFLEAVRNRDIYMASDCETFGAFDICYDYDTHTELMDYLKGIGSLEKYLDKKRMQETIYPENYAKLRFLENHDNLRAKAIIPDNHLLEIWTAFMFFEKGPALLYSGQEAKDAKLPSLFDTDPIDWSGLDEEYIKLIKTLATLKKDKIFAFGRYKIHHSNVDGIIYATYALDNKVLYGIFNVSNKIGELDLSINDHNYLPISTLQDGRYANLVNGNEVVVTKGKMAVPYEPVIFWG